jgi:hypothetical protein
MTRDLVDRNWLYFYTAAAEATEHLGLSAGKAQRMLREACATGDIRTKQMVVRAGEWVEEPTKPSDWAKDEIDIEWQRREGITADTEKKWYLLDVEKFPDSMREAHEKVLAARRKLVMLGVDPRDLVDPDDDSVGIFVSRDDFQYWLDELKPPSGTGPAKEKKPAKGGKAPLIIEHLKELYPQGVPDPSHCPRKALKADLLARDKRLEPLDDATLKSAIDAFNHSIRNDPK